jgi:hypothetical protein
MEGARYATWSAPTDVGARPPEKVGLPAGFWLIGVGASVVFSLLLLIALPVGWAILAGVALGAFFSFRVSMISVVSEWFARRRKGSGAAFAMYKAMGMPNAYPVRVNVILDAYQIGTDEGLVEFSDGLLKFHGTKTRFAISADSVNDSILYVGSVLPRVNGMDHVVQIWPFERLDPNEDRVISHIFVREFEAWKKADAIGSDEIVLPPKTPARRSDIRPMRDSMSPFRDVWMVIFAISYMGRAIEDGWWGIMFITVVVSLSALGFVLGVHNRNRFYRNLPQ